MAQDVETQKRKNRERAKQRRESGLCGNCNQPKVPGKSLCEKHVEESAERSRQRYWRRRQRQVCTLCPVDTAKPAEEGKSACRACLDKQNAATATTRPDKAASHKAYKQATAESRKQRGVCIGNGCERPARDGRVTCGECAKTQSVRSSKRWRKIRLLVIAKYGSKCACCGEATMEFLQIDHINGGGNAHRREIGRSRLYIWLIRNNFPAGFQVLCADCNFAKGHYGSCPHSRSRTDLSVTQ